MPYRHFKASLAFDYDKLPLLLTKAHRGWDSTLTLFHPTAISHHKKQPIVTELLKAPVSEKLFVFTDQPYFFSYKTKLNEKEKGDGHNHMKNNGDTFEKPEHEPQQHTSIAYPSASSGSAHPIKCAM